MSKLIVLRVPHTASEPDASFWRDVPPNAFSRSRDEHALLREGATVRYAWNERGLFVHAELEDGFLIQTDHRNEQLHFQTGDVFELFIKPADAGYYWEMYATPFGNRTTLFFPEDRQGMTVENFLRDHRYHELDVKVEAVPGGWSAGLFVPAEQLTALGASWCEGARWRTLCGRYNYHNATLRDPELSMWPAVSTTNYHLVNEYAYLELAAD